MTTERKNRILIVDDTQDIHDDIKKVLSPSSDTSELDALVSDISGFSEPDNSTPEIQIDSALQGDTGVAMVRQAKQDGNPYALAFVDIRIPPGLDGIQTIKQMQIEDPCLQYIIITAYINLNSCAISSMCVRLYSCSDKLMTGCSMTKSSPFF